VLVPAEPALLVPVPALPAVLAAPPAAVAVPPAPDAAVDPPLPALGALPAVPAPPAPIPPLAPPPPAGPGFDGLGLLHPKQTRQAVAEATNRDLFSNLLASVMVRPKVRECYAQASSKGNTWQRRALVSRRAHRQRRAFMAAVSQWCSRDRRCQRALGRAPPSEPGQARVESRAPQAPRVPSKAVALRQPHNRLAPFANADQ